MTFITFRPRGPWQGPRTEHRRSHSFTAAWRDTVSLLQNECRMLMDDDGSGEVVVEAAASERDVRRDGLLRADARIDDPGIVVSFASVHGPLRYACDTFEATWLNQMPGWQANVRAVALALGALRQVSRYGVGQSGEQYRGWNALPAGTPMPPVSTLAGASELLSRYRLAGMADDDWRAMYHSAAKITHPDAGGDPDLFLRVRAAYDLLTTQGAQP